MKAVVTTEVLYSEPFMLHHVRTIRRWTVIIPGTRYWCEVTECPCGLRDQIGVEHEAVPMDAPDWNTRTREVLDIFSVPRVECLCTARTCRLGSKAHKCHGWHQTRVDKLIKDIEKMPARHRIPTSMKSYERSSP